MVKNEIIHKISKVIDYGCGPVDFVSLDTLAEKTLIPKKEIIKLWLSMTVLRVSDELVELFMAYDGMLTAETCDIIITKYYTEK
jgi:hypothetical protein